MHRSPRIPDYLTVIPALRLHRAAFFGGLVGLARMEDLSNLTGVDTQVRTARSPERRTGSFGVRIVGLLSRMLVWDRCGDRRPSELGPPPAPASMAP